MKTVIAILLFSVTCNSSLFAQGWQQLGTGSNALKTNGGIYTICTDSGGIVYAAGGTEDASGNYCVVKWDGSAWAAVGSLRGFVCALCTDQAHNLYAACEFTDAAGYYYVAKWNGILWTELGTGANALKANSLINTICTDAAGNVYAAGSFTDGTADTNGNFYVAKWDGTRWSELGTGVDTIDKFPGAIWSIIADASDNIYAAGDFAGLWGYHYVIMWNGTKWSELGTGANALNANFSISSLYEDKFGNIYAGGFFTDGSGNSYVAMWNGTTWMELGTGSNALNANYNICTITGDTYGNIYCAGYFEIGSFGSYSYVAKWNGISWNEVGTGAKALIGNAQIYSITTDSKNNLYAAGAFTDGANPSIGYSYVAEYAASNLSISSPAIAPVSVYPNPCRQSIYINADRGYVGMPYSIIDIAGRLARSGNMDYTITYVDISMLSSGVYYLKWNDNIQSITKFVKE